MRPQPSSKAEHSADLETRILAAEQAVIRRDARFREQLDLVGAQAQRLVSPVCWLSTVGGGLGALLLGRLLGGGHSRENRRSRSEGGVTSAISAAWPLVLRLVLPVVSRWLERGRTPRN